MTDVTGDMERVLRELDRAYVALIAGESKEAQEALQRANELMARLVD